MPLGISNCYAISQHSLYLLGLPQQKFMKTTDEYSSTDHSWNTSSLHDDKALFPSNLRVDGKRMHQQTSGSFSDRAHTSIHPFSTFYMEDTSEDEGKRRFFSLKRPLWCWAQYHRQYSLSSFCTWPHSLHSAVTCCDAMDQDERKRRYCC